jgi:phenylalanyl-tRNA synthetase beta chain
MRAPLSWIREFTPVDAPVPDVVSALNQLGLEVDSVEQPGAEIGGVVAARVLEVLKHPDADKLALVDVDFGAGQTRVVCGAPNVVPGMVVPYAPSGATLPGGITLESRKIRGQVSDGMLCSARELGLGDDHSGILSLDPDTELGRDAREVLGLDDVIFDLAITPNRPDAMCIVGVARELAAHFTLPLAVPEPHAATDVAVQNDITVAIEAPERCPRYLGRVARVTMGDSPAWMAQRLVKAGMRPISNVVDVTNYVLLERNQPLHAFDLSRLGGRGIVVRLAADGETMTTLDGVERTLNDADLLICDADRTPQAIAGIMGGSTSEVSGTTTEILLESAYFEPLGIARSSKRLKLRSESSGRFERGIDPEAVARNAERAMELLTDVAGAHVAPDALDEHPVPVERVRIQVRTDRVNAVLGTELDAEDVWDSLAPLGIELDAPSSPFGHGGDAAPPVSDEPGGGVLVATVPTFRPDLEREIDLVEEVARRIGFDRIGRTRPDTRGQVGRLTPRQRDRRAAADALVGLGLSEAITLSLVAPADLERAGAPTDRVVRASNPLRAEESVLRTAILPGLLRAVAYNRAHGTSDLALFELGRVFLAPQGASLPDGDGGASSPSSHGGGAPLPEEPEHLAIVLAGTVVRSPIELDRPVDVHDAVDALRAVTDALRVADLDIVAGDLPGFQRGRAAEILAGGRPAGTVGEVAADVLAALGLDASVVAVELDLEALADASRRSVAYREVSRFPASSIDLAFVVDSTVPAGAIERTLRSAGGDELESVHCFDVFSSPELGEGRRSLAFTLRYRAPDRTLTDADVSVRRDAAIAAVTAAHGATLRG